MRLKVYNTQYDRKTAYFFTVEQFNYYEGEAVKVKWAGAHELAIKTPDAVGLRIIQRKNIREIDGQPYQYSNSLAEAVTTTRQVTGSKGQVYTVTQGAQPSCTCPGFTFRGTCKHIKETANAEST